MGLFGPSEEDLFRTKYQALRDKLDAERDATAQREELHRVTDERVARANEEREEANRRAQVAEGVRLLLEEREAAQQLQHTMLLQTTELLRQADKESDAERRKIEQEARENERLTRQETERKIETVCAARRDQVNAVRTESTNAIRAASNALTEAEKQSHQKIEKLILTNHEKLDQTNKEFRKTFDEMQEKLRQEHQLVLSATTQEAKLRQEQLLFEMQRNWEHYQSAMEKSDEMTRAEREKLTEEKNAKEKALKNALEDHCKDMTYRVDQLHREHQDTMFKNQVERSLLYEKQAEVMGELHREKEEQLASSGNEKVALYEKMLTMSKLRSKEIEQSCRREASNNAMTHKRATESLNLHKAEKELRPLEEIKQKMIGHAARGNDLYSELSNETKREIEVAAREVKRAVTKMILALSSCTSIGEANMSAWKAELQSLSTQAIAYEREVRDHIQDATKQQLQQLELASEDMLRAVFNLSEMRVESLESAMARHALHQADRCSMSEDAAEVETSEHNDAQENNAAEDGAEKKKRDDCAPSEEPDNSA